MRRRATFAAGLVAALIAATAALAAEGELRFVACYTDAGAAGCSTQGGTIDGLDGVDAVAVSPDGKHVYGAGSFDNALAAFARNPDTGELGFVEFEKDGAGGVDGLDNTQGVTVSPDGRHVYATGFDDDSLAAFTRDPATGALGFVEVEKDGVGGVDGLNVVVGVAVSPDGKHVYTASGDGLAAFARDPNDTSAGHVDFVEFEASAAGVNGLDGAAAVTVSPDGKHVYVASFDGDSLAAFARNPDTGQLDLIEFEKDGAAGVDGLDGAYSVAVSPDGKHAYVASLDDSSLAAFARDPGTGRLDFIEFEDDGAGGVDGLDGASSVAVSADGKHVYVVSIVDNSLAAFARNPATGALDFVEFEDDGASGVDGLEEAYGVAVAADGKHVYTAADSDDALAAFAREADVTPPDTTISKGPRKRVRTKGRRARIRFEFESPDPFAESFACKLDRKQFKPCASPFKKKVKKQGEHKFKVRATDTAGNTDPSPAKRRFRVRRRK